MHDLYLEERTLTDAGSLSWDLTHHLYARSKAGKTVIISNEPDAMLASLRKQWFKLMRQIQKERAKTLNAVLILALSKQLAHMQNLHFAIHEDQITHPSSTVIFSTTPKMLQTPPICQTMYVAQSLDRETCHLLSAWMPPKTLLVRYIL